MLGLLNTSPVQTYIVQKSVAYFSNLLGTTVSIEHVNIKFFNHLSFKNLLVLDEQQDTLLYTRALDVSTSQWFLLTQHSTIKDIKLQDAQVQLLRNKSTGVWNYNFIIEKLGLNNNIKPKKPQKVVLPNIDLNYFSLNNAHFLFKDEWVGIDYEASAKELYIDAQKIDLKKGILDINTIFIDEGLFGMTDYKGGRPDSLRPKGPRKFTSDQPFNPDLWSFNIDKIQLINSRFFLEMPERPINVHLFDERHLNIKDIDLLARKVKIEGDTITGDLRQLNAQERSGLGIKKMSAQVKVSPKISECANLYLETHNTIIKDYYAMHYDAFPAFLDYIHKVKMVGKFKESKVSFKDIAYFTDQIDFLTYLNPTLTGEAIGTIPHLMANNIILKDEQTTFVGNVVLTGLPSVDAFHIDAPNFTLSTNNKGLIKHLHMDQYTDFNVNALQNVLAHGNFKGFINNFNTETQIKTNLGHINLDAHILNATDDNIIVNSKFEARNMDFGKLTYHQDFGSLTARGQIQYELATKNTQFNITAQEFSFNKYPYKNIHFEGNYQQSILNAVLKVADPNLATQLTTLIDFRHQPYHYKVYGSVPYFNSHNLNLSTHQLSGGGEINLDLKGKTIDDVIGNVIVYNVKLDIDSTPLAFNQLYLNKSKEQGVDILNIASNGLQINASGHYNISELPQNVQYILHQFVPNLFQQPKFFNPNFDIKFNIHNEPNSELFKILNIPLELPQGLVASGNINFMDNIFDVNGNIPTLYYDGFNVEAINLSTGIADKVFNANITGKEFYWNNYLIGHQIDIRNTLSDNLADLTINTTNANGSNASLIQSEVYFAPDTTIIKFKPSSFYLNDKLWQIESKHPIFWSKNYLNLNDVQFKNAQQSIHLSSNAGGTDIVAKLQNISLDPINYLLFNYDYQGNINGDVVLEDLFKEPNINFEVALDDLKTAGYEMGEAAINGAYNIKKNKLTLYPNTSLVYNNAYVTAAGEYWVDEDSVRMSFLAEQIPLQWLQPYVEGYVHNISGVLNGFMTLNSYQNQLKASGKVQTKNAKMTVDITGVTYTLDQFAVSIDENNFYIDQARVLDSENNKAIISGKVPHHRFSYIGFDLNIQADKIKALALPVNYNAYFFGDITASVKARLTGMYDNINFHIIGTPLENSILYIPIQSSSEIGTYNYITFKKPDTILNTQRLKTSFGEKIKYVLRIDALANNNLEGNIILDPRTNDQLQARGEGNLSLIIPSDGDIRLNGTYTISDGFYNFAFQQLEVFNYRRKLLLENGSTIKWNGDLYDADLNVDAYTSVKARLFDLISNEKDRISLSTQELSDAQMQQIFNVKMKMQGRLSEPRLTFNIQSTENRSVGTYAYQKLQRINNDERELLNQVTGLLLLNQFIPPEGFNSSASLSAGAITNMSEMLATVASSQISNLAKKVLGVEDLYIGLSYKNYALSGYNPLNPTGFTNRNEAGVNFRKNFLNNRLTAEVGGTYDWGTVRANNNLTDNIAGDFRIQYSLNRDGNVRLKLFRTSNYDAVFQQTLGRHGAGIMYRKSFNNLNDLFNIKKKQISDNK